jgi:hydroxypyruvate reductase
MVLEVDGMAELFARHASLLLRSSITDPVAFVASERGRVVQVIVTPGSIPLEKWMWHLPGLRMIACMGVGYDGIDLSRAHMKGITVTAGREVNREDVADLAIGLMIAVVRQILPGDRLVRSGKWVRLPALRVAGSITRMRLGIVGLRAIGMSIGRRLTGFGAAIAWWGPNPKLGAKWPRAESLMALAWDSDVLIVAAPSTPASRQSINEAVLQALGPHGYLVNVSRGDFIDETALHAALAERRIVDVALDVYAEEPNDGTRWREFKNVVMTPHLGARAARGWDEARQMCAANVGAFLNSEPLVSAVPMN